MEALQSLISPAIYNLWLTYVDKQERGLKKETSSALSKLITELKQLETKLLTKIVFVFTDYHREETIKIDFRLFQEILFPVLLAEVKKNTLTANRRLAQFDQFLLTNQKLFQQLKKQLNYIQDYFEPIDFYKKEIELNSKDNIAVEGYLTQLANKFNHYTHELPDFGLLCEIEVFTKDFNDFKEIVSLSNEKEKWSIFIQNWELIKEEYKND